MYIYTIIELISLKTCVWTNLSVANEGAWVLFECGVFSLLDYDFLLFPYSTQLCTALCSSLLYSNAARWTQCLLFLYLSFRSAL